MGEVKAKKSKQIFLYLRIAVIVCGIACGIYWGSREQRWSNLTKIFLQMNWWLLASVLCVFIISQVLVGLRWWLLLRTQSVFIRFWAVVKLHFLGLFYNNFMPSSVGGDLIRAWYVTRHTDRKFEAALSVFADRAVGLLSTLIIAAFSYMLFLHGKAKVITSSEGDGLLHSLMKYKGILLWIFPAIAVVFCILLFHKKGRSILTKLWLYIRIHSIRIIVKLRDSVVIYCSKPGTMLMAFGITLFLQIMVITSFWFLGQNLGISVSIKYYYVFFTMTWVLGTIPVSIGGAVVVEVLLASLFINFAGVAGEKALALALCQRIVLMLASLPGAVIHLVGAHLPKDFSVDYEEPMD